MPVPDTSVQISLMDRPQRWSTPFGEDMGEADVDIILRHPLFANLDPDPLQRRGIPLRGLIQNDTRLLSRQPGAIVVRQGDYGNSAFLILKGDCQVIFDLPPEMLGRLPAHKKTLWGSLAQLWSRHTSEMRDTSAYKSMSASVADPTNAPTVFLQDIPTVLQQHKSVVLHEGALFGELAALGRIPRTATVIASTDATLLEIRWQGLRDLRRGSPQWQKQIDETYRRNALNSHLQSTPIFKHLSNAELQEVARATLFETYGAFDWFASYMQLRDAAASGDLQEPVIVEEGDYADGLLLVRAGFARVTAKMGKGQRTLTYLGAGDVHGLEELYESWRTQTKIPLATSLRAVGYVDALRVPTALLEKFVFPKMTPPEKKLAAHLHRPLSDDALQEWLVHERFINGTKAMVIDLDRCTRCDDCVRACAASHDGNPRFLRNGQTFDHWMVAHACMHCADPVCMIGCPTGAIHRNIAGGMVVINDLTCIGCGTCASSCPYENIFMVPIRDLTGSPVLDTETRSPILKATKCDLCAEQRNGPSCVRACPHDALSRTDFLNPAMFQSDRS